MRRMRNVLWMRCSAVYLPSPKQETLSPDFPRFLQRWKRWLRFAVHVHTWILNQLNISMTLIHIRGVKIHHQASFPWSHRFCILIFLPTIDEIVCIQRDVQETDILFFFNKRLDVSMLQIITWQLDSASVCLICLRQKINFTCPELQVGALILSTSYNV